jgi:hypothetical protein
MLALLLMAMATLGAAWSTYQSSLWNGVQTFNLTDAARSAREASQAEMRANQQRALDAALVVQCSRDFYDGKQHLVRFFLARMRPELREAFEAWIATEPHKNPNAPATPFVMPQYHLELDDRAKASQVEASANYEKARKANRTGDIYTLATGIYTSALFLAGLVSGFDRKITRRVLLALSFSMLLLAVMIMAGNPVARPG